MQGLRQRGGYHTTFSQNVPGSKQIAIIGESTLRAGPVPDIQVLLAEVEPHTQRSRLHENQPLTRTTSGGNPAPSPATTGPVLTSRHRGPPSPPWPGPGRQRPGPSHRSLGHRRRCSGPACGVRPRGIADLATPDSNPARRLDSRLTPSSSWPPPVQPWQAPRPCDPGTQGSHARQVKPRSIPTSLRLWGAVCLPPRPQTMRSTGRRPL